MDGIERMERKTKTKINRAMVAGGGSQSKEICQITADMLGIPVCRVQTHETSGLGAAIIGFTGMKEFENIGEAVKSMVHNTDMFTHGFEKQPDLPQTFSGGLQEHVPGS